MPTLLEEEIDRALEGPRAARPVPAPPVPTAPTTAPPRIPTITPTTAPRRRAPDGVVRFSPMFEAAPPAARRRRRILVGASVAVHVVLAAVIFFMPKSAQTIVEPSLPIQIVFTAPVPSITETVRLPEAPKPLPRPKPRPERREDPPPPVAEAPKSLPKPVLPEPVASPVAKVEPKPQPVVRTGLLDESPSGQTLVASKSSRALVSVPGFETAALSASSHARPGRVTDTAFDSANETPRASHGGGGLVRESGFGEEAVAAVKKPSRGEPDGALDTEVEIVSKAKPVYTDEARALKIEGDVVLDVIFQASGVLTVLGVVEGLGHGLDEAAIVAAKKIVFNPARRGTKPVDHAAKLRVVFRLA